MTVVDNIRRPQLFRTFGHFAVSFLPRAARHA